MTNIKVKRASNWDAFDVRSTVKARLLDRNFGGKPLQPDSSKLHQIAICANPNRIDAEVSGNSVILRQADVVDVPPKLQTVDTNAPAPEDTAPLEEAVPQNDVISETQATPAEETVDETSENTAIFSSRRTAVIEEASALDTTIAEEDVTPVFSPEEINLAVSSAVQALKSSEAIDRWLEATNEKMAMPEHVSKANALEPLKAAVAATEAERATRRDKITSDTVIETGEERRNNTISFHRELAKVRKACELETNVYDPKYAM